MLNVVKRTASEKSGTALPVTDHPGQARTALAPLLELRLRALDGADVNISEHRLKPGRVNFVFKENSSKGDFPLTGILTACHSKPPLKGKFLGNTNKTNEGFIFFNVTSVYYFPA